MIRSDAMNPTVLNSQFQHPADGWYQIEALGSHPHPATGLTQLVDAPAARSIVNRFNADAAAGRLRHGHELLIDHEHFSDQPDQETRAYGWLQELQNRDDGIYARIRWTATGRSAVDGGDYRFFSTEYDPADLQRVEPAVTQAASREPAGGARAQTASKLVRPLRLAGLTLTNMNNNRGQKPITNRAPSIATPHPKTKMNSLATLLGLSADADEATCHAAVSRLLNRADITTEALALLRAEHQSFAEQNQSLLAEQSEALLDGCGVRDERLRNRLKDGLKLLKNRQERLTYLADFGLQPGEPSRPVAPAQGRLLNRGNGSAVPSSRVAGTETDQALALKIQNRASELQGKGLKYDSAWNQARRELLVKN
jgi:phage I-like protein